jgi:hypothetical protein
MTLGKMGATRLTDDADWSDGEQEFAQVMFLGYQIRRFEDYIITLPTSGFDVLRRGIMLHHRHHRQSPCARSKQLFVLAADVELVLELFLEMRHLLLALLITARGRGRLGRLGVARLGRASGRLCGVAYAQLALCLPARLGSLTLYIARLAGLVGSGGAHSAVCHLGMGVLGLTLVDGVLGLG